MVLLLGLIVDKGSDINHRDIWENTALSRAVKYDHRAIVGLLLTREASLNERNEKNDDLLHLAINKFSPEFIHPGRERFQVIYLLTNHPSIQLELRDAVGATALRYAAGIRNRDLMAMLVDRGADIEARDSAVRTPLHYCVYYERPAFPSPIPMLQYLVHKGANINAETNHD